jgi:hypothetical protein
LHFGRNLRGCLRISNENLVRFDMTTNDEDGLSAGPIPIIDPMDPVTPGLEPSISGEPMPEPGEEPVSVVTEPLPPVVTDESDPPVEGGGGGGEDDPGPGE